jgi:RimJ/RimL family protein N-acetyltransferase
VGSQTGTLRLSMTFDLLLRPVTEPDVDEFFAHSQTCCPGSPADYERFSTSWLERLADPTVKIRTITVAAQVVGYIGHFIRSDLPEVSYELGPQYWGKGFATAALQRFVGEINVRPLYARVAKGNARSIRVLQKCGFSAVGEDRFVAAGGREVEEFIFALDS